MSPVVLVVMGLMVSSLLAIAVWIGARFMAPPDKARRAGLAALLGGTAGFTTTALVQGPFYNDAARGMALTPLVLAVICATGMALLAAWMILKTRMPPKEPPSSP